MIIKYSLDLLTQWLRYNTVWIYQPKIYDVILFGNLTILKLEIQYLGFGKYRLECSSIVILIEHTLYYMIVEKLICLVYLDFPVERFVVHV